MKRKRCRICNEPLKKEGRTEHYGCRCARLIAENIDAKGLTDGLHAVSRSKRKKGLKAMEKKRGLFLRLFT